MSAHLPPPPPEPGPPPTPPLPPPSGLGGNPLFWLFGGVAAATLVVIVAVVAVSAGNGDEPSSSSTLAGSTLPPTDVTLPESTTSTAALSSTTTSTSTSTTTSAGVVETGGSWTVLVYFLGDNNLEDAVLGDLQELASIPDSDSLALLALVDRAAGGTDAEVPGVGNWAGAKLLEIRSGSIVEIDDLGETNLGDPATLTAFVSRGIDQYPADHYALVLWDHGSIVGVGADKSHDDVLTMPELASGLEAALQQTGVGRLDIIGFDACLMGAVEVASWVAPHARYMIGSENLVPNAGWDYRSLGYVVDYPEASAEGIAREVITRFIQFHGEQRPNVTLSLFDLDAFAAFQARLGDLAAVLVPDMDDFATVIGRERTRVLEFGSSPIPAESFFMIDLGQLLAQVGATDAALTGVADAARLALEELVLLSGNGPGTAAASGLSVHFPPLGEYYQQGYATIAAPEWVQILEAYYAAGADIPPEQQPSFAEVGNEAAYEFTSMGLTVNASFDSASIGNIVEAVLLSGIIQEDGSILFIGEDQGLFDGSLAVANYNLTTLVLSDGEDEALAYTDVSFSEDLTLLALDVPVAYVAPGAESGTFQDLVLSVQYDSNTDRFTAGFFMQDQEAGTIGQFTPDPQGFIFPWLLQTDPEGGAAEWVTSAEIGLWADPNLLTFSFEPLASGTEVYSELVVFDFGGNSDFASVTVVIP